MKNIKIIGLWTIFAFTVLISYYFTQKQGVWFELDRTIFYFFNHRMAESSPFLTFVAIINNRLFDVVSFATMGLVYLSYFHRQAPESKRRMIGIGITMLLMAIVMKQLGRFIPVEHVSPTLYFPDAFLANDHVSFTTKDRSGDSFPSDHGMFLMIFSAFMWRYFGKRTLCLTIPIIVIFSLPRIMIGAHWFSDIYAGSLFMACFVLSWFLLTPVSDICINAITALIPKKFWSKS